MTSTSRILELANVIQDGTQKIEAHFQASGKPSPSNSPADAPIMALPPDLVRLRDTIVEAGDELNCLLQGPIGYLTDSHSLLPPLYSFFSRYPAVASSFPASGTTTFSALAAQTDLTEDDVRRLLRSAMTHHIFVEPSPGVVAHTACSRALVDVPLLTQYMGLSSEEIGRGWNFMVEAMSRWPGSEHNWETGYNLAAAPAMTGVSFFEGLKGDKMRKQRFEDTMRFTHQGGGFDRGFFIDSVSGWPENGLIVDVGGAAGDMCFDLARRFPHMRLVSQDLPEVIEACKDRVPEDVKGRVELMVHDFMQEQPVKNADGYLFRWIFHDWADGYTVKILQQTVPALKKGARILISDVCLPVPGSVHKTLERKLRGMDLGMKATLNGKERGEEEWKDVFKRAGAGFKLHPIKRSARSRSALIEAEWVGT